MGNYTVVLVYGWNKHGGGIKDIFKRFGVKWNSGKMKDLSKDDLLDICKKYDVENYIGILGLGIIGKAGKGKSGVWENVYCAIKIVMIEGNDIIMLIYKRKSEKDKAWNDFVQYSKDCGSLVQFIEDGEVVFRDRINVELINTMNDMDRERDVRIENFTKKAYEYGNSFKEEWIKCIMK